MANDLAGNPWICDTAEVITTQAVFVKSFRWVSKTATAGDDLVVNDNNGKVIFESVATGANYVEAHDVQTRFYGIDLATLDSGKLYIYV